MSSGQEATCNCYACVKERGCTWEESIAPRRTVVINPGLPTEATITTPDFLEELNDEYDALAARNEGPCL